MSETEQLIVAGKATNTVQTQVSYTVQIEYSVPGPSGGEPAPGTLWMDIATIPVAPRTHRKRLITKALIDAGIKPVAGQPAPRVRVLDEESAFTHEPEPFQPEAEWRVQ